ncbi:hypothetical protein [Salinisphaera sp. G21_0]|uniref:hypothetical protein n=1 Tax=Salinisphaera sp. G21_0 TaxID=2821094 RepID=UPI001ADC111C|nr:hypothetical protein [Salinisphaera sp. G21_0]MBO9484516.1 hypothetical protein [Salinisphaera sp. G21_0]
MAPGRGASLRRSLGSYTLMAADAITRKAMGAADKPTSTLQDNPLLGSFVRDKVTNRNRYTDELHEMTVDINEIPNSIKRYQESGEGQRAKDQEQSAVAKLKHKAGLQKASREINKLRDLGEPNVPFVHNIRPFIVIGLFS